MEQVEFNVKKMGCGACGAKVNAALASVSGVEVVNVKPGLAVVRRDPAVVTDSQITESLKAAGNEASPREVSHEHAFPN